MNRVLFEYIHHPLIRYLEVQGVKFNYDAVVTNIAFKNEGDKRTASEIIMKNWLQITPSQFLA